MKYCPSCNNKYDDSLFFCLNDGTPLAALPDTDSPTVAFNETEEQTVIRNTPPEQVNVNLPNRTAQNPQPPSQIEQVVPQHQAPPPPKSNTATIVLLTAFAMLLLFGAGLAAWLYLGKDEIAQNKNTNDANVQNRNQNAKPTPTASASPTATATPKPDFDPQKVKSEVSDALSDWETAAESVDLNTYMNSYADTIDYYKKSGASRSFVRSDKQRAFDTYDSIDVNLSNMTITPDATGERATVVLDKEWTFEGAEKYSSGKVRQQISLVKSGGRWLISGEKDLKVYYTNN